ncbi:hypothetical protein HPP92_007869 [Vanilla planifolia]|uniref:Uncharacterized protein n=1 Tax=Vanilla planifolia TaxID=51239 RepID=A0A835VC88_VANPL|nr:hypothetical protein HPP92_007869 [Vanilla planifolia]
MATGPEKQQNAVFVTGHDRPLLFPKPRKLYQASAMRSLRFISDTHVDSLDPNPGIDLLDMLFSKEAGGPVEQEDQLSEFFCGSPPVRSDNPVAHDARFGEADPLGPLPVAPAEIGSGFTATGRSGCTRVRYGLLPAAVRVEGFDYLDRDRIRKIQAAA